MPTFDEFYASMNPDEGTRGNEFEKRFVPWFLQTDPEWKSQIDHLWLWKDYPQRWGRDCGIDLVFRDTNGKDWAVQTKCLNPDSYITKADINSFLSESSDKRIHGRLLIATTDRIGLNARQVIERQEKQVVLFLLDNFRKSEIEFPASLQKLLQGKRKAPRNPHPHQTRAIRDVVSGLSNASRGQLIMACGTGKTLTALWVKEHLKCEATLVLVPSLSLLSQTLREWTASARIPFQWLCVCSDATVATQGDEWVTRTCDIGVPVTGDVKGIKSFLRNKGSKVIFSTYQSSPLVAEAQKDREIPAFNLVLADEAHRCAGKVSEAFGCVLDPKRIRTDKLLFMTATPRVLSGQTKSAAEGRDIEVASMDDPAVFGDVLHQLTFSQAIEKALLSDYRVVIVGVDDPLIQGRIQNRDLVRTSNGIELDAQTLASHIALAKATKKYDLRRVISFHGRVSGAKQFAADHTEVLGWMRRADRASGTTTADYVSGDMSSGDRNTKLNRLRHLQEDERGVLSNARCLSEGVDVPSLDGVAFIDPRKSPVDIVQAVGRAIRKSEGKTCGTIVIPVFIDDGENEEEALESSRFRPVWDVVTALKAHDDDLAKELDSLRIRLGARGAVGRHALEKIIFDLPARCAKGFADALRTRVVEVTTKSWGFWFGLLQAFVEDNGTATPPVEYVTANGLRLGHWASRQRVRKDFLKPQQIQQLESMPGWLWDTFGEKWNAGFQQLVKFARREDSAMVPQRFVTRDGFKLGVWVSTQISRSDRLTPRQRELLESLPGWSWDFREHRWMSRFRVLLEYVEEFGDANPASSYTTKDGLPLGKWCSNLKTTLRKSLSEQRAQLLESLPGWTWTPRDQRWNDAFAELRAFTRTTGSATPPFNFTSKDGFRLGAWVVKQRSRKDLVTAEQASMLESLSGWTWDRHGGRWAEGFRRLKDYTGKTGSASAGHFVKTKDGYNLGHWVATQRRRKRKGVLPSQQRRLLESLPGWSWEPKADRWTTGFALLQGYVNQFGSANPPRGFQAEDGFKLGTWVSNLRRKKKSLPRKKKQLLESLRGWSWASTPRSK